MIDFFLIVFEFSLLYMPLLFGVYLSFSLMKTPDLSIETAYLFGALFAFFTVQYLHEYPLPVLFFAALGSSMVGGACVGMTSSMITQYGKIPHLLSAIITFGLYHGVFQLI